MPAKLTLNLDDKYSANAKDICGSGSKPDRITEQPCSQADKAYRPGP